MAAKKKGDEVESIKSDLQNKARAVGRAAKNSAFLERRHNDIFGKAEEDWDQTLSEVDDLDEEFATEEELNREKMNRLKQKFERGDVDVRVMEVGPDGKLTDVSDRVNPKDLRPDQIGGIQTSDGRTLGRLPQSREAALRLLQEILPGLKLNSDPRSGGSTTANSIRRMEAALADSDKILEHWKK
jgi:hypothetical protein